MITRLATALQIPLGDRNALLQAAGFADLYPIRDLSEPDMAMLKQAVTRLMMAHDPFPSFVVDRHWNVRDANRAGRALFRLIERNLELDLTTEPTNMIEAILSNDGFRPLIENWEDYVRQLIQRLHREALINNDLVSTLERMKKQPEVPKDWWSFNPAYDQDPAFPIRMRIDGKIMSFFTVVTAVAMPASILAQELRVETMFPANQDTEQSLL